MGTISRIMKVHQVGELQTQGDRILQEIAYGYIALIETKERPLAVILDYTDFRILIAALRCTHPSLHTRSDSAWEASQACYNHAISRYLSGEIDLVTTSDMLNLSWVDLLQRLSHIGIPLLEGSFDLDDSIEELRAIRYLNFENWV